MGLEQISVFSLISDPFKKNRLAFKRKNTHAFIYRFDNVYIIKMREFWAVF